MTVRFEVLHPHLGVYGVTLQAYQWGFTDGSDYLYRVFGTTAAGVHWREPISVERRWRQMRFVGTDAALQGLRTLSIFAQRFVRNVYFYPDYSGAPGTYWVLDWESEIVFSQVLDSRLECELRVTEKVA